MGVLLSYLGKPSDRASSLTAADEGTLDHTAVYGPETRKQSG